ncbi:MAG: HU family DNA-binding protein [Legionellales bacterium]|nr:HU family DNA-binding protein [Legionellales bacterium]
MNKTDLIESIIGESGLSKDDAVKGLDACISVITKTLVSGGQIAIPGFGTFSVSNRAARTGRNPRTGESIEIPASRVPKFKPGKNLKEAVAS